MPKHTPFLETAKLINAFQMQAGSRGFVDRFGRGLTSVEPLERSNTGPNRFDPAEWRLHHELLKSIFDDPNMKLMLFDAAQAVLFDDMGDEIDFDVQTQLHTPFERFWLEFTEPVKLAENQPGHDDWVRAFYVARLTDKEVSGNAGPWLDDDKQLSFKGWYQVICFLSEGDPDEPETVCDRGFMWDVSTGMVATSVAAMTNSEDPSPISGNPYEMRIAGADTTRRWGWWERSTIGYGSVLSWMMAYMMAKGIEIIQQMPSRADRRRALKQGVTPQPWHLVRVEPRFVEAMSGDHDSGSRHSYRYDVMGHLRFGKHRLGDGTYRRSVEWVRPHQRGLANATYIPKTYFVDGGKQPIRNSDLWTDE
jgi:hypothetical protein